MSRLWVSILTLIIYGLAQYGVLFFHMAGFFNNLSGKSLAFANIYTQVTLFIIAAFIIIIINNFISNPTQLEQQHKEKKRYAILWSLIGYVCVMFYQIIAGIINMYVLGGPKSSPNTEQLMKVAQEIPVFIILISVVGPILEEYVFRKVIFGELYNLMKGSKALRFIVASIVSSIIFSAAHGDPAFFIIYFGMGMIFSGLYAFTKRIWVPIVVHMMQNGFVVIIQVLVGPEKIKELQETASFIFNLII
ncbi:MULTISPECIES: intramembrane glutamic endopeptidase MroQ [Staphylococcus]|jgi:membrane protease YdiL (CAAX protease family)|uniref:Abortive infection protein n=1 Tax=Staphylococcus nepalensis TaxID=214473 RepID=A0A291JJV6_9STAP|nr:MULTISPECIES: CPBP family intramembrane glutamic endopeptidase [Staphylococcus]VDG66631.1 abortive infection protein [Lacrimispora indolis]ATH59677.1 CAAX protease [Staphylococcus nepalensis]ATH64768.1 CAAX protease [Staphylococcus nepalensis]AWI44117.1 CAAX protease [Staphylococcus nepalensis]MBO1206902.1 CPBP family intramembrane metalloprotease [Staphylococcus nepalensis]